MAAYLHVFVYFSSMAQGWTGTKNQPWHFQSKRATMIRSGVIFICVYQTNSDTN